MYMLGTKRGFGQSKNRVAQSMDLHSGIPRMILIMRIAVSRHVVGAVRSEIDLFQLGHG